VCVRGVLAGGNFTKKIFYPGGMGYTLGVTCLIQKVTPPPPPPNALQAMQVEVGH
jgi:hypothetical protein